jgi:uncharacterized protein (TIGR03792 family)
MVIEWLKISVPTDRQSDFLRHDQAIWTEFLAKQPGFAGKECWCDPDSPEILHLVIRWDALSDWQSVPKTGLAATEHAFAKATGKAFAVTQCIRYDVVRPPP